jgi:hypothetical protein
MTTEELPTLRITVEFNQDRQRFVATAAQLHKDRTVELAYSESARLGEAIAGAAAAITSRFAGRDT